LPLFCGVAQLLIGAGQSGRAVFGRLRYAESTAFAITPLIGVPKFAAESE
jgi:hypothetical protein